MFEALRKAVREKNKRRELTQQSVEREEVEYISILCRVFKTKLSRLRLFSQPPFKSLKTYKKVNLMI